MLAFRCAVFIFVVLAQLNLVSLQFVAGFERDQEVIILKSTCQSVNQGWVSQRRGKLGSRLGREPSKSEITFVLVAIAALLLLLAGILSALVSPRLP